MQMQSIGRKNFRVPSEKEFPFRRTVFVYGLPPDATEDTVKAMLSTFGSVTKAEMDKGPDTLDRDIMANLMKKNRVFKLLSKTIDAQPMTFCFASSSSEKDVQYTCVSCNKSKYVREGYYRGAEASYLFCLQCAALRADETLKLYETQRPRPNDQESLRERIIGIPPRAVSQCQTALCVFASQRQASKCVYVRSRLSDNGAFATHYHHYTKLKKDIAIELLNSKLPTKTTPQNATNIDNTPIN
ncbi:hypothetical protein RFI_21377 [Reticulomyxa filosa]|uniref:RRM domain-containing protein n=1 Tax=Reticulomyxa filosa TaxID=46433 RepID=X6MSC1_RETFI|nr:hypothetical protein RFI_21377 [Reticulomyxa filosa]|eukprot:ETO15985.1 hypothetical protein RFI_21377 [Reticulomyxa filosa]